MTDKKPSLEREDLLVLWRAIGSRCHQCGEPATRWGKTSSPLLAPSYECCDEHEAPFAEPEYTEHESAGAVRRLKALLE